MRTCCANSATCRTISAGFSFYRPSARGGSWRGRIVHACAERSAGAAHETKTLVERFAAFEGKQRDRCAGSRASIKIVRDHFHQAVAEPLAAGFGVHEQIGKKKIQPAVAHDAGNADQAFAAVQTKRECSSTDGANRSLL